jgi:hypothetical protein
LYQKLVCLISEEKKENCSLIIEVEYDAKRDEKEKHETKMKEVQQIEELRKEKEAQSKKKIF